jgi:putative transposase
MPRQLRRDIPPGYPLHVLQRGHNRASCFGSDADNVLYLGLLQEYSRRHECTVHAYALMTNHVHLLVSPPADIYCLSRMMRSINQVFGQHTNRHRNRCGSVWQGRPKMCVVDVEDYFLTCQRYIELNPVRAGMVAKPGLYPWSSYSTNADGHASGVVTPHPLYLGLGASDEARQANYRNLFERPMDAEMLGRIRSSVNRGTPLSNEEP